MTQFNQFAGAGNPACFGTYDATDSECSRCTVNDKCYPVTRDRAASNPHAYPYPTTTAAPPPAYAPYAGYTPAQQAATQGVLRPAPLKDFPLGTEMLPVGEEGQHGPVRRAVTGAVKEAIAHGGGAFFDALARFAKDISAWDRSVGTRRYGDNWRRAEVPRRAAGNSPTDPSAHALPPHASHATPHTAPSSSPHPPPPPPPKKP